MSTLEADKTALNETSVDRELEGYSGKLLSGNVSLEDQESYEKLMTWRRNSLLKLPSVKLRSRHYHSKLAG